MKEHLGYMVVCPICCEQEDVHYKRDYDRLTRLYRRLTKKKGQIFTLEDRKEKLRREHEATLVNLFRDVHS